MRKIIAASVCTLLLLTGKAHADILDVLEHVLVCTSTIGLADRCQLQVHGTGAGVEPPFPDGPTFLVCSKPKFDPVQVLGSPRSYTAKLLCRLKDSAGNFGKGTSVTLSGTWDGQTAVERIGELTRQAECSADPWIEGGSCDKPTVSGMTSPAADVLSAAFPAAQIPEGQKKLLRLQANTPVIELPQNNQAVVSNLPFSIKVKPNPAVQSQYVNVQITDMAGKVQSAKYSPSALPKGLNWPHKLAPGFAGLSAQWDYAGAPRSTSITLVVKEASSFPPPGASSYEQANKYLLSQGCKWYAGRSDEYTCKTDFAKNACQQYEKNPALGIKKCH